MNPGKRMLRGTATRPLWRPPRRSAPRHAGRTDTPLLASVSVSKVDAVSINFCKPRRSCEYELVSDSMSCADGRPNTHPMPSLRA